MRYPFIGGLLGLTILASAADVPKGTPVEPATHLAQVDKLIGADAMTKGSPAILWKIAKGRWERLDLGTMGGELPADRNNAILRLPVKLNAFVVAFEVRLEGAANLQFRINTAKEHLARVIITPTAFTLRRDDYDGDGPEKAYTLFTQPTTNDPGTWHTVVFEMVGETAVASLDGKVTGWGQDPAFAKEIRVNPSFHVDGSAAAIRQFSIWAAKAEPKATWAAKRDSLPKPLEKPKKKNGG